MKNNGEMEMKKQTDAYTFSSLKRSNLVLGVGALLLICVAKELVVATVSN